MKLGSGSKKEGPKYKTIGLIPTDHFVCFLSPDKYFECTRSDLKMRLILVFFLLTFCFAVFLAVLRCPRFSVRYVLRDTIYPLHRKQSFMARYSMMVAKISALLLFVCLVSVGAVDWSTLTAEQLAKLPASDFTNIKATELASIPAAVRSKSKGGSVFFLWT